MFVVATKLPLQIVFTTVLVCLGLLAIAFTIIEQPLDYFRYQVPAGQLAYVFSKVMGFSAIFLMGVQLILGLLGWPSRNFVWHKRIGFTVFLAVFLHVALFTTAVSMRTEQIVLGVLVPSFVDGFYKAMVSLGVLSFWGVMLVMIAGVLRSKGAHWARWVHYLSFPIFFLAAIHSLQIGTESRFGILQFIYGAGLLLVTLALLCQRWLNLGKNL